MLWSFWVMVNWRCSLLTLKVWKLRTRNCLCLSRINGNNDITVKITYCGICHTVTQTLSSLKMRQESPIITSSPGNHFLCIFRYGAHILDVWYLCASVMQTQMIWCIQIQILRWLFFGLRQYQFFFPTYHLFTFIFYILKKFISSFGSDSKINFGQIFYRIIV